MKIERGIISFELSEKQESKIKLALASADIDADKEFDKWINSLAELALRKISGEKVDGVINTVKNTFSLDNQTRSRIDRWIKNKRGANYGIIKAYFLSERDHDDFAIKDEMETYYNNDASNISPFLGNFRMLCCDSAFSAKIFNYDKANKIVTLDEKYKDYILKYKNEFL